jgi:hypothetical protein
VNKRPILGLVVIAAGFVGTVFGFSPVFGFVAESFLVVEGATIFIDEDDDNELAAEFIVEGLLIPVNGTEGAFGYGILTGQGDTILVAHTHSGVLDSEDQRFIEDPSWHTHLVRLGDVEDCEEDRGVVDITWQSPGEVRINNDIARISNIPTDEFEGWDSMTDEALSMRLGPDVSDAISFKLDPHFNEDGGLEAMCMTDIRFSEEEVNLE